MFQRLNLALKHGICLKHFSHNLRTMEKTANWCLLANYQYDTPSKNNCLLKNSND